MTGLRQYIKRIISEDLQKTATGTYLKPEASFFTLAEWEDFCNKMLSLQSQGHDTRGGGISMHSEVMKLVRSHFNYQLDTQVPAYDLLTFKNVTDFIEDFVNHRFWSLESELKNYFQDVSKLKIAYFYSRGDLEPYALIDEEFTTALYGSTWNLKRVQHYTSLEGIERIKNGIEFDQPFDISTFTVAERPFFRKGSNYIIELIGNVRAGFRSDIKSYPISNGRRAVNLHRLEYPGKDINNICYELDSCDGSIRTSLWNEYIATPIKILKIKEVTDV